MLRLRPITCLILAPISIHAGKAAETAVVAPDPAESLIREAAQHSPLMLEQELQMAQADAFRFRGWRQYMPYITANYQAGYFNLIGAADPNATEEGKGKFGGSYAVTAYHPLYQWGAIEAEKKFAFARENAARSGATIAWRALAVDIREKFLEAALEKARVVLLELRVEAARARLARTEQEFQLGRIVEMERAAQRLETRNKELELTRKKIALASLLTKLRSLAGVESFGLADIPGDLPDIEWDDAEISAKLESFEKVGIEETPETRQAKYAAEAYSNQRVMAEAKDLPSFNLGASITQTPVERNGGFGMQTYLFAGLMGSWNIFDRDTARENVRALRIAERLVETKLTFGTKQRITDLRNAVEQLKSARQARDLRRDIVKLRNEAYEAVKQRVKLGLTDKNDLSAAEDALLSSKLDLMNDRATILKAYHAFMAGILLSPTDQFYSAPTNDR